MYTYQSFETHGTFTLLRPIYMTLLIFSIILFIAVVTPKIRTKFLNWFVVLTLYLVLLIVSVQVVFHDAIIVDELGLGGDSFATTVFVLIASINFASLVIYSTKSRRS